MDNNSLAHTRWNCKYHIIFAPKYRRQVIYGEIDEKSGYVEGGQKNGSRKQQRFNSDNR